MEFSKLWDNKAWDLLETLYRRLTSLSTDADPLLESIKDPESSIAASREEPGEMFRFPKPFSFLNLRLCYGAQRDLWNSKQA